MSRIQERRARPISRYNARSPIQREAVPLPLNMRFLLGLRAIFFVLLLPGTVAGYIPFGILSTAGRLRAPELSLSSVGASILAIAGTVVLLRCVWDFFATGKGTLGASFQRAYLRAVTGKDESRRDWLTSVSS